MTLFSLIVAFLLEQLQPLNARKVVVAPLAQVAGFFESRFNDGQALHGAIAWLLAVVPLVVAIGRHLLRPVRTGNRSSRSPGTSSILYLTMGFPPGQPLFRRYPHGAARRANWSVRAASIADWRGRLADRCSSNDVARMAIEEGFLASHRYVFAVVFWFVLLPGPSGALLYRLADFFGREWGARTDAEFGALRPASPQRHSRSSTGCRCASPPPASPSSGTSRTRCYCWRTQASRWVDRSSVSPRQRRGGSGSAARHAGHESGEITERPELGLGEDADADFMQSAIGLVIWRTLVLCLLLLSLL
ncbi:MAG: hypothetical protein MZW92_28805 [Comamonadaceae bacterium]|nr:hypothetical protein [Comamonadaceae bacterium]